MSWRRDARRDERGAAAVVFALCALLLFGVAAMGVDLGNAMDRKKRSQNNADVASLAGAAGLPDTTDATRLLVANYLNKNQPRTDGNEDDCDPTPGPVTVDELKDGSRLNGEVVFTGTSKITVYSPASTVNFGLANAMGISDTCVNGVATARIASGGFGMSPYYATSACSTGPQVLKSDAGGPSLPFTVPVLSHDSETNASELLSMTPNQIPLAADGDPDGPTITLTGTELGAPAIDQVGFFNSDQSEPVVATPLVSPAQTATSVSVNVPNAVAKYQDVWWVRVHNATTNTWSARVGALPLLVGEAVLSCDPESSSGNFGSIDLPWGGNDLQDLEKNIADGPRPPTTLKTFPSPLPADNSCNTDPLGVISTDTLSKADTNCVQSVTGLKANPAYDGYLKNSTGRLRVDTSDLCRSQGRPQRGPYDENSDILSCFLKNDTLHLSDTIYYHGSDSLYVQDIWKSPRFVIVPLLDHDPSGTKWMPIKGFVAGFITDQPTGASRPNPIVTNATDNGLVIESPNKLRAIRIFFFSLDALPPPPDGTVLMDYIGSGKKVITLVN